MSAEIEFKLTSIAKADLANLLDGETIEIYKAYITNAQSGSDESYVADLSGTVVFNGVVNGEVLFEKDDVIYTKEEWEEMPSGTVPDNGILHIEFFDDSENYYSGKTVAITYTKELEERIFCIATVETSSDELVVKHFSPLSFALELRFENADSVSFNSINLAFPPATETRRGSVKIASSTDVMSGTGTGVVTSQNLSTKLGNYVTLTNVPSSVSTTISSLTDIGAIRLFCVSLGQYLTVSKILEGTTFDSSGVKDDADRTYNVNYAHISSSYSNGNSILICDVNNVDSITGTWKVLTRAFLNNAQNNTIIIPFLAIRIL